MCYYEFCNPRGKTGSIPWCKPIIRPEEKWCTEILFFPPFFYFSFASQNRPNASITLLTYEYGISTQDAISYRSFRARIATFFWTNKDNPSVAALISWHTPQPPPSHPRLSATDHPPYVAVIFPGSPPLGDCRNSFFVFVSDRSRSGIAENIHQIQIS